MEESPVINGIPLSELPEESQNLFANLAEFEKTVVQPLYNDFNRKKITLEEIAKLYTEQLEDLKVEIEEKLKTRNQLAEDLANQIEEFKKSKEDCCGCDGNCNPCTCKGE